MDAVKLGGLAEGIIRGHKHGGVVSRAVLRPDHQLDGHCLADVFRREVEHAADEVLDAVGHVTVGDAAQIGTLQQIDRLIRFQVCRAQEGDAVIVSEAAVRAVQAEALPRDVLIKGHAVVGVPIAIVGLRVRLGLIRSEFVFRVEHLYGLHGLSGQILDVIDLKILRRRDHRFNGGGRELGNGFRLLVGVFLPAETDLRRVGPYARLLNCRIRRDLIGDRLAGGGYTLRDAGIVFSGEGRSG